MSYTTPRDATMEDWSPSEDQLAAWVQSMWISGCRLLISAHLAQQWVRLADPDVPEIPMLREARNAIEHLHEADFDDRHVIAGTHINERGKEKAWDIKKLPEGRLILGLGTAPLETVFGAVSLDAIVAFSREHATRDDEVEHDDSMHLVVEEPDG